MKFNTDDYIGGVLSAAALRQGGGKTDHYMADQKVCDDGTGLLALGEENDAHIERAAREVGALICAWGSNAKNLSRPLEVMRLIKVMGIQPKALKINSGGIPAHPLMLPYTCQPTTFN